MKKHSTSIVCPACGVAMEPVALGCEECGLRLEGRFEGNEFARLGEEDLHFLRIFVHCEGRIRDMESALGVSYPTIKARLAGLKAALGAKGEECEMRDAKCEKGEARVTFRSLDNVSSEGGRAGEILARLEAGEISAEDAARALRGETCEQGDKE